MSWSYISLSTRYRKTPHIHLPLVCANVSRTPATTVQACCLCGSAVSHSPPRSFCRAATVTLITVIKHQPFNFVMYMHVHAPSSTVRCLRVQRQRHHHRKCISTALHPGDKSVFNVLRACLCVFLVGVGADGTSGRSTPHQEPRCQPTCRMTM